MISLTEAENFEYPEKDIGKPLKNITLSEADSIESYEFKPFEYERGSVTKFATGVVNTIRDMQDMPEQLQIFGNRLSFGFGGYFGDTPEETERKRLNLVTAERNLDAAQRERYQFTSGKEQESIAYGVGGGVVSYGSMLVSGGVAGGAAKALGASAKVAGALTEAAGITTMGTMELAGAVQDKTRRTEQGEIDIEAMTPEWARNATGGTVAYTALSAITEKYVGFGRQLKMWEKPVQWGNKVTSNVLTAMRSGAKNAISEGATEGLQDLEATGIGLIDGTVRFDELPARIQQAWKSAIIGGIIGDGVGTAVAIKSGRNVRKQLRDMVYPVVGDMNEAQSIAEAMYNAGTDELTQMMSVELELSSELKNKHGKVWNSMLAAVSREMKASGAFNHYTEDEFAQMANTASKHFADNLLAEANFRGTTLDAILKDTDIAWDKSLRLKRNINVYDALKNPEMIPPETKLKDGMMFSDYIETLNRKFDELGIDTKNMSADELEKISNKTPELKVLEKELTFYDNVGIEEDANYIGSVKTTDGDIIKLNNSTYNDFRNIFDEQSNPVSENVFNRIKKEILKNKGSFEEIIDKVGKNLTDEMNVLGMSNSDFMEVVDYVIDLIEDKNTVYQTAFHGTGVQELEGGKFSVEKMGTGEGHAAHGYGIYATVEYDIADKKYRKMIADAKYGEQADFFIEDKLLDEYNKQEAIASKSKGQKEWDKLSLLENMLNEHEEIPVLESGEFSDDVIEWYNKSIRDKVINKNRKQGQVFELNVPEDTYLLNEQLKYENQPENVKKALDSIFESVDESYPQKNKLLSTYKNKDGASLYMLVAEVEYYNKNKTTKGVLADDSGAYKLASEALNEKGVKGITYDGREDGRSFVIFNPNDVEVIRSYYQRGKEAKGKTTITPDEYIIKLLEGADESTLAHELAHYWLDTMFNYVRSGRASENYMKRWQNISDYLGIKPEQTRLTRGQQEKFASSYEAYITRGELPTPLIGSAFDDYDKWLQRVYSDYNKINYQSGYGKRKVRLTDAAIKFFQSMTTGTLEAPALAPKDTGVTIPEVVRAEEVIEPTNEIVDNPTTYDTTRVINITEGEKGVSKVFQREAMKHADRIVDELGVSYNKINLEEQAIKATEWVQNNLEEARKVVNGAAAPEGIIDTAIFIAYENEMLRIGNNEEYQRALKIHSQVQTQRGQAIAAERITTDDVYNPAYWWKKLQNNKEKQVAQKLFKGDVKALNELIDTETKKIMKEIAGKPKEEQVEKLTKLAEKLQKDYGITELYQMPDDINERTVQQFVKDALGVNPDVMAGNEVINKAEQLQKLWESTKDKSGNPSVEAMKAKRELNDLIQAQTPSNALAIWTSIFGRGIMLTSVKSPVLNIISNIEAGFTEGITRRLMYGTTEKAVDKSVKQEFSKYAWEVYKASADIVTTMNDYDDDMRIIGEQILHSQGQGRFRAASRKVEEVSFKYLMGAPDAVAKTLAFNDTADLLATKIAKEEGAKDISARATEIYKDAILIKPQTEVGQKVREQAQAQAHYTTFTNDSWAAKFGLSARNWLNMVGRNKIRLGDLAMKFVKTPANVQMMGLEYGFGSLYTIYNIREIIKNPQSETSQIAIKAAVRNGLGIALAALLYSMLDPDDYFSEFDTLNPKEKDRMRALGAMPNSIKIGGKWVSLDYFGQLGIPLVGMLEARKNNSFRSYLQSGFTQAAKIPGIKETKQLIDSMSEYARYDLKPEKILQMMAGTVLDQARAMTIPAIVNDIAKMTDDYERDTMGGVMDKVISSIPGLRQTLPERYGIQGLVKTEPALSTLLFGSRVKTAQEGRLVREIDKLAGKDEQPSISDVTKYGDLRLLSPEKKVKVRKEFYKAYNTESKKLISTREYQKKSPDDKKKALNKVRSRVVKSLKEKYSNDIQREKRRR